MTPLRGEKYNHLESRLTGQREARGYPDCMMPDMPYDEHKRACYLSKYASRARLPSESCNQPAPVLPFKVKYSDAIRPLRLKSRIEDLLQNIRSEIGDDFLRDTRVLLSFPTQRNQFLAQYARNFLPSCTMQQVFRGCGGRGRNSCISQVVEDEDLMKS